MAIYPDKKNGEHTGRWRVELQRGKNRYRKRWDAHADAVKDEQAVLAAWDAGDALPAPGDAPGAPEVHTFSSIIPLAEGHLWEGQAQAADAWAHVKSIADILGKTTRLDAVTTHSIDTVIKDLRKQGLADGTINRYLSHLRTFLDWSLKRGYRTVQIKEVIDFQWREEEEGRIRWVTEEEEEEIKSYLLGKDQWAIWATIKVAMETGCRRNELLTVERKQINGHRLHLWKTKTNSPRTVPMSADTLQLLTKLVDSGLMPNKRNLRSWWERMREHMGLTDDEDFVFHTTRHTCATRLLDAGVNLLVIKEWMGHKRIETTLRYAHVKPQNLEDALVRVGEYRATVVQFPQKSAGSDVPHTFPTGGATGHFTAAA